MDWQLATSSSLFRMGSFTSVLLMVLLLSIGFEYYCFWPDGSKKQTHSRISVSITKQAVITPNFVVLLYYSLD